MKDLGGFVCGLAIAVMLLAGPAVRPAEAATITYLATDLADPVFGQDVWVYAYFVSDFFFQADQGFAVYFDPALYADLQSPPPQVSPEWDVLTVQPDPLLPSAGFYDALALIDNPSLDSIFTVTFTWLGLPGTAPGPQPFTINEFDQAGVLLGFIESGQTVAAPLPEPAVVSLLGCGALLASRRRRTLRRNRSGGEPYPAGR